MRRLGIDFGASETVIVEVTGSEKTPKVTPVLSEPNLVHLREDGSCIRGRAVIKNGLVESGSTARHMRHFILTGSPIAVRSGGSVTTYRELAQEYLISLIQGVSCGGERVGEVIFSLPNGAPPRYREWMASVAAATGIPEYFFIDEITAAASGYGIPIKPDQILMLIDFGGGKIEVIVARPSQPESGENTDSHVIARAMTDTIGHDIDRWIADAMLPRCSAGLYYGTRALPEGLLAACRAAKEELSSSKSTTVPVRDRISGKTTGVPFTRKDLNEILSRHDLAGIVDRTIVRALDLAQSRGCDAHRIRYVLMTGTGCLIPAVRDVAVSKFGKERVWCDSPGLAIASGAAQYRTGPGRTRSLVHDYALRYWDAGTSCHEYRYIARRGTVYPTEQDTARIHISAAYDGQTHLGLALYAFAAEPMGSGYPDIELVTDLTGKTCCIEQSGNKQSARATRINETDPAILIANPPGRKGELRFELAFRIDSSGFLRLTARDLKTGVAVLENHSCAKLT